MPRDAPLGPDGQKLCDFMAKMIQGNLSKAAILRYLELLDRYEKADCGSSDIQPEPEASTSSDELTAFQVRGLRSEIVTYHEQPKESSRILRVLRRLNQKALSDDMILDTGVQFALHPLLDHPRDDVKDAALDLLDKWEAVDPFFPILAAHPDLPRECPTVAALKRHLSQLQTPVINSANPGPIFDGKPTDTARQALASIAEKIDSTEPAISFTKLWHPSHTRQAKPPNVSIKEITQGLMTHYADTAASTGQSVFSVLAPDLDKALARTTDASPQPCGPANIAHGAGSTPAQELPTIIRCRKDFLAVAKNKLLVDDQTIGMLSPELTVLCNGTLRTLEVTASIIAAMVTLEECPKILQGRIRDIDAEISALDASSNGSQLSSPLREGLLEAKLMCERAFLNNEDEIRKAYVWKGYSETIFLEKSLLPMKKLVDELYLPVPRTEACTST